MQSTGLRGFEVEAGTQSDVAGVVLAAGLATRMGRSKMDLTVGGRPLLWWAVAHCLAADLSRVIVVAGPGPDVRPLLPDSSRISIVVNPRPEDGQASSLGLGLAAVAAGDAWAAVFLGDMPCIWPEIIQTLTATARRTDKSIIRPVFQTRPGHPVIFHRLWFPELTALTGDQGGRALLAAHPEAMETIAFDAAEPLLDVDTESDLAAVEAALSARAD